MSDHPMRRCDQCGQTDDHPRVVGYERVLPDGSALERYLHHDCLAADQEASLREGAPHVGKIIEAAKNGVHGDELRAHIERLHKKGGK